MCEAFFVDSEGLCWKQLRLVRDGSKNGKQLPDMGRRPSRTPPRRDTAVDTPTQDVLCHRAPPRHVHDMVSHRLIFIKVFVLFHRLHLVSIVCDVSVGRRGGLSGACYSARNHSADGLRPAAALPSLCILPFSRCTWLVLGRSSSRAIPGLFRVAATTSLP